MKYESKYSELINLKSLSKLKLRIYAFERDNFKTQKYKDTEMIERIRRMIEVEAKNDN